MAVREPQSCIASLPCRLHFPVRHSQNVAEVSARRSDRLSTQRHAHSLRRGLRRKETKNDCLFPIKNAMKKEVRGKGLLFWLPMLYYEGSGLNERRFPSGIETLLRNECMDLY